MCHSYHLPPLLLLLLCVGCWSPGVEAGPFPSLGGTGDLLTVDHGDQVMSRVRREAGDREKCGAGMDPPAVRVDTAARVTAFRTKMTTNSLAAYVIPMDDEHQSEYVSEHDARVKFISGFSGSAGTAVVTQDDLALWTDGRYFTQAEDELDCKWKLMKSGELGVPSVGDWLEQVLSGTDKVGADSKVHSYNAWNNLEAGLNGLTLEDEQGLIDDVWDGQGEALGASRPPKPNNPLILHDIKYSGANWDDKVKRVRAYMTGADVGALVITALDETAWLFSLRGADVPYNPVFFSYALLEMDRVRLYVADESRILGHEEFRNSLKVKEDGSCQDGQACAQVKPYVDFFSDLGDVAGTVNKVWISPMSSYAIFNQLGSNQTEREERAYLWPSIVRQLKGRKNPTEVQGMRNSHIRDSAVLIDFIAMLEKQVKAGDDWTEVTAAAKLKEMREAAELNQGLSFGSISAVGSNGAIIHYRPQNETDKKITTSEMYLLDSGGQYLDGTTDVTRTFHFGEPTALEKEAYTRVLMGSIDLAQTVWPNGTYGRDIDSIARSPIWSAGWNYRHGTGHGIGAYLSVHEGPGRISMGYREQSYESALYGEMFFSDEPGYYEVGKFGVRLETIVMTKKVETAHQFGTGDYLGFELLTMVPFEPVLIDYEIMSAKQRKWLNMYHTLCDQKVGPMLEAAGKTEAYDWMKARTAHIPDTPVYTAGAEHNVAVKTGILVTMTTLIYLAMGQY